MVKVSVILPVYNSEKHLAQCLDSILAQTLQEIEMIFVNDGSKDGSLAILQEYAKKDSRITVIDQENRGAGAARNRGLAEAKGEYLLFLDADDFFEPDLLSEAYDTAKVCDADIVLVASDEYHMDIGKYIRNPYTVREDYYPPYNPFSVRELTGNCFFSCVGWAWDKLMKRSFVEACGLQFQEQRTTNDLFFVYAAWISAKRIAYSRKVLVHQRRGGKETLSVTREQSWDCFYHALTALQQYIRESGRYWELERDFVNYALHFSLWNVRTLKEPTRQKVVEKLKTEWFDALGVNGRESSYFYDKGEYEEYLRLK